MYSNDKSIASKLSSQKNHNNDYFKSMNSIKNNHQNHRNIKE